MAAAELIREHETIGFTAGTTTTQVARCIRHRSGIHVITNAVNIGMELSNMAALNVTLTGGTMRWAGAFSLTGPAAMETLSGVFLSRMKRRCFAPWRGRPSKSSWWRIQARWPW